MRSDEKSTKVTAVSSTMTRTGSTTMTETRRRTPPANAFSQDFLLRAATLEDPSFGDPECLTGGAYWAGPWDVEAVEVEHGVLWAVVRAGDPVVEGGRAAAVLRSRSTALLVAAALPALAVPDRLTVGETSRRLGVPVHDGEVCLGHLARAEPAVAAALHVVRALALQPHSLALVVEALGREELPILGRALMRRLEGR